MEVNKSTALKNINLLISRVERMTNKDIVRLERELNNINPDTFEEEIKNIDKPELINNQHISNRLSYLSFKLKLKTLFMNPRAKKIIVLLCKFGLATLVINYLPTALTYANSMNAFLYVDDTVINGISGFNNVDSSMLLTIASNVLTMFSSVTQVFTIILSGMLVVHISKAIISIGRYMVNKKDLVKGDK